MLSWSKLFLIGCFILSISATSLKLSYDESNNFLLSASNSTCYGVIFDAGSSSTKLNVFSWPCRDFTSLPSLNPISVLSAKASPGISAFASNTTAVSGYLQPLLNKVKAVIPVQAQPETPIMLGATAGMRLLSISDQNAILKQVKIFLNASGFRFNGDSWARVISGQEEGIYLWISVNYLLGAIKNNTDITTSQSTVTTIDLGGASTQIAFKSTQTSSSYDYNLDLPENNDYTVYSVSYLGYGNDQARDAAVNLSSTNSTSIYSGCFNYGYNYTASNQKTVIGTSKPFDCLDKIRRNFNISRTTNSSDSYTYSISDTFQPRIPSDQSIYAVSAVNSAVDSYGLSSSFYAQDLLTASINFCSLPLSIAIAKSPNDPYIATKCFLGLYASSLLIDAYQVGNSLIQSPDTIKGAVPSWAMGFMFNAVSEYYCDDSDVTACSQFRAIYKMFKSRM